MLLSNCKCISLLLRYRMMVNSVSPVLSYKYPIDINITVYPSHNEYEATIQAYGIRGPQSFPIGLTPDAVEQLNAALRQAIEEVRKNCEEDEGVDFEALQQLADVGK